METMLIVEHISKRYGSRMALRDVSFTLYKGEVIALLGRNGAGKSTLMNILTGYIAMTEGRALIAGHDVQLSAMEARRKVGYLPEQPPLYPDMTVREYLRYCAQLKGIAPARQRPEVDRVIERTGLEEYAKRLSGRLSKGYRQRLGVAQALLGSPAFLILDEPGSGLDPLQLAQMREVIRMAGQESTVLLSSHILSEVTNVCSRALVLENGQLRFDGHMAELLAGEHSVRVAYHGDESVVTSLENLPGVLRVRKLPMEAGCCAAEIFHDPACDVRAGIFRLMVDCGAELLELTPHQESLETAFLRLMSEKEDIP